MAQPSLHFAVGASFGTLISLAVGPLRRRWYRMGPLLATVCGLWACLPDVDHLWRKFGWLPAAETIATWEYAHAGEWWYDLFFFHGWMDRNLAGRGTIIGLAWIVALYGVFFWLLSRRVGKLEAAMQKNPAASELERTAVVGKAYDGRTE